MFLTFVESKSLERRIEKTKLKTIVYMESKVRRLVVY